MNGESQSLNPITPFGLPPPPPGIEVHFTSMPIHIVKNFCNVAFPASLVCHRNA